MNADQRAVGGAGGVGPARFGANTTDPQSTSVATIRTADTALTKAGVAPECEAERHRHLAGDRGRLPNNVAAMARALL